MIIISINIIFFSFYCGIPQGKETTRALQPLKSRDIYQYYLVKSKLMHLFVCNQIFKLSLKMLKLRNLLSKLKNHQVCKQIPNKFLIFFLLLCREISF